IFLMAARVLSLPVLLAGPRSQTMAVAMFDLWVNGQGVEFAALGLLWTMLMTAIAVVFYLVVRRGGVGSVGEAWRGERDRVGKTRMNDQVLAQPACDAAHAKVAALLNPRNIVILGASERPGNWAQRVWRNLRRYGFPGAVFPFNPARDRIWDTRCYR